MANLLQSSQTQATTTPDYYTNYLSGIASAGAQQAGINPQTGTYDPTLGAQFVGPTNLQQQAFNQVGQAATGYQPELVNAENTLNTAGTSASPLSSANPYLTLAGSNPAMNAAQYMNPYTSSVANQLNNIGQRNIQQNLAPNATASAVGSGQYGSQRGAQVLGQTTANAENDLNTQIGQLLNTGYGTNLNAAVQQNQIEGQLGSTAANAASAGQQNLTNVGQQQANLASTNQALGLGGINALSTLGGQQQTIAQNQQLFPLTNLSTLSSLLRGYNVPTTTKTTAQGSPLSGLATVGSGVAALLQGTGASGTGPSLLDQLKKQLSSSSSVPGSSSQVTPVDPFGLGTPVAGTGSSGGPGRGQVLGTDGKIYSDPTYETAGTTSTVPNSASIYAGDSGTTGNTPSGFFVYRSGGDVRSKGNLPVRKY
jgi:hypothetical protein